MTGLNKKIYIERYLNRNDDQWLHNWLSSSERKPLILRGARQVGKSFLVQELARANGLQLAEINFEAKPQLSSVFLNHSHEQIITLIEQTLNLRLSSKTLLFLDEIQSCPSALSALRYFFENRPDIPVVAAGSLLEFTLNNMPLPMPVGRVTFRWIHPFTFAEFLAVRKKGQLLDAVQSFMKRDISKLTPIAHHLLLRELALYTFVGGMPEAIRRFVDQDQESIGLGSAAETHNDILLAYRNDFSKYHNRLALDSLHAVLDTLPKTVGNTKIKYSNISRVAKSDSIKKAIENLEFAGVLTRVTLSQATGIPLGALEDVSVFKLLPLDIGLFVSQIFSDAHAARPVESLFEKWEQGNIFEKTWLGQVAEVLVGQALSSKLQQGRRLHYWLREGKSGNAEVDYLMQLGTEIVPVEVKAGASGSLRSLHTFAAQNNSINAVRFDLNLPSLQQIDFELSNGSGSTGKASYKLHNFPLYLADWIKELI